MRRSFLALVALAALPAVTLAQPSALDEVNAKRAARGLPAFQADPGLTAAAQAAAEYRARYRIAGHVPGQTGDFAFLPAGVRADAAGCGGLSASYGWMSCCTYDPYQFAGAASVMGADGLRYNHIFVSNTASVGSSTVSLTVSFEQPAVAPTPMPTTPAAAPCGAASVRITSSVRIGGRCGWLKHRRGKC